MNFLAMKFSFLLYSMTLKFVSLVWIWFLLHWLLMRMFNSDAARSAMIDIIAG